MATIDIIILIIFVLGAILGFMKGFLKQLATLLGLIVGLLAAKALYAGLAEKLSPILNDSMTAAQIVAFVGIWIAVPLAFTLIASLLTKAMEFISLGWLNRWLGAGLGVLKYMLFTSLIICVIEFLDSDNKLISKTMKQESALYYPMEEFAGIFFPVIQHVLSEPETSSEGVAEPFLNI
ncbi:MAG: CvpA family protein [Bacteroides sp.]|nr:CvpA family protein [Bacteroides sp.]